MQRKISQLKEEKEVLNAYGPGLAIAERGLIVAAVESAFGDHLEEHLERAKENFLSRHGPLLRSLERINTVTSEIGSVSESYKMLGDPNTLLRALEAATAINTNALLLRQEDADSVALRNFATHVTRTLSPEEFFGDVYVNLDQLGFESEGVVRNVRRVIELAGKR